MYSSLLGIYCNNIVDLSGVTETTNVLEFSAQTLLKPLNTFTTFKQQQTELLKYNIKNVYSLNRLISKNGLVYINDKIDLLHIYKYIDIICERAFLYNVQYFCFGSGEVRNILHSSKPNLFKQFVVYFNERALQHNIKFTLEPLSVLETNILNSYKDVIQWLEENCFSNIGVTFDTKHLGYILPDDTSLIEHVHICSNDSIEQINELIINLKNKGYSKKIILEPRYNVPLLNRTQFIQKLINN